LLIQIKCTPLICKMSEDKVFSIIFNGSKGKKQRKTTRLLREKKTPEECEVIVPPSMRKHKQSSNVNKNLETVDEIPQGDCFDGIGTNNWAIFTYGSQDTKEPAQGSPSIVARNSDIGSVIQPSSHAQYQLKNDAKSASSWLPVDRKNSMHTRTRLHGDNSEYNRLPTGLSPLIKERLENYYPNSSIETSSSALSAIQKEIDQIIVRPKSRLGENPKLQSLRRESESRNEDCLDISCKEESSSNPSQHDAREDIDYFYDSSSLWQCW
jgi:hypothetical protein